MKRWRIEEIENVSLLLESGNSLKEALTLVNAQKAKIAFSYFSKDLLNEYLKKSFPLELLRYLLPILAFHSLQESLPLALSFFHQHQKRKDLIRKKLQYPFLVMSLSLLGLVIFKVIVFPSLFNLVANFKGDTSLFRLFNFFFNAIYISFLGLIVLTIILVFLLSKKSRKIFIYSILAKYWRGNPWVLLVSYEFVSLWQKCRQLGLGSKDSLFLISKLKSKTPISFLAFHFMALLEEGKEMEDVSSLCYIDENFKHFISLAMHSQKSDYLFERYLFYNALHLEKMLKFFINMQQVFIYMFIGGLIIMVYQILFMPLKALSSF